LEKATKFTGKNCALLALGLFGVTLLFEVVSVFFPKGGYVVLITSILVFILALLALFKNNLSVHLTFAVGFMMVFSLLFIFIGLEHINPPIDYSCETNGGLCIPDSLTCENYGALKERIFVKDPTYRCKELDRVCCLDVT
jgi:hypothetical protein